MGGAPEERRFRIAIGAVCLAYVAIELLYLSRLPLIMDEYQGALAVHKLAGGVPYRDFVPYKTVLGYYLELLPLSLPGSAFDRLFYVKYTLVAVNAAALFAAALLLARRFSRVAVCLGAIALVAMSNFLERSAELRVDMLTAWFGLFSLLAVLERRMILAGVLLAASFLTSQKGIYYAAATALALAGYAAFWERGRRAFLDAAICGGVAAALVGAYFAAFGLAGGSAGGVAEQVVVAHKGIALERMYGEVRDYWFQSLERNPFFYAAAFVGIGVLFARRAADRAAAILWIYGLAVFAGCFWHRQPWPYFFVILAPTGFLMIVALFDGEVRRAGRVPIPALVVFALLGVGFPLLRVPTVLARDLGPQRNAVRLAEHILGDGEAYLDGVAMVFDHPQPKRLGWLDRGRLARLRAEDPRAIIADIERARVKLTISNYRLRGLPRTVAAYLARNYAPLHGNVNIYCPTVDAGAGSVELWFAGAYAVRAARGEAAAAPRIDGSPARGTLRLAAGAHGVEADGAFRLCLVPDGWRGAADPKHARPAELFPEPYEY